MMDGKVAALALANKIARMAWAMMLRANAARNLAALAAYEITPTPGVE
jgi:hypothetical protein